MPEAVLKVNLFLFTCVLVYHMPFSEIGLDSHDGLDIGVIK